MDPPTKHFILLLLFISFSTQAHSRGSRFFSKTSRPDDPAASSLAATQLPNYENNAKTSVNLPEFPNEKYGNKEYFNTNYNYVPSTLPNEKYGKQEYYNANDNEEKSVGSTPQFPDEKYGNKEYFFSKNGKVNDAPFGASNEFGMSDTRFVENGKYFYDVNAEENGRQPLNGRDGYGYRNSRYEENREFQDEFANDP